MKIKYLKEILLNDTEKLSMTYEEVDEKLFSKEGLLNIRIVIEHDTAIVQEYKDSQWIVSNFRIYELRVKRIAVRQAYKMLKATGMFDPTCEFMTKLKYETNASLKYMQEWQENKTLKRRKEKIENLQHKVVENYTIARIEAAAEKYENLKATIYEPFSTASDDNGFIQPSIHMQFDKTIYRILDFYVEDTLVKLSAIRADIPFENIQFHETYKTFDLTFVGSDENRIVELMKKVEAL